MVLIAPVLVLLFFLGNLLGLTKGLFRLCPLYRVNHEIFKLLELGGLIHDEVDDHLVCDFCLVNGFLVLMLSGACEISQ